MSLEKLIDRKLGGRSYLFSLPKNSKHDQEFFRQFSSEFTKNFQLKHAHKQFEDPLNSPDILIIDQVIPLKVDELGELFYFQETSPMSLGAKICFINNAELLTPIIQNKLLKILEEPLNQLSIILINSSTQTMMPTILSRTIQYKLTSKDFEYLNLSDFFNQEDHEQIDFNEFQALSLMEFIEKYKAFPKEKEFIKQFLSWSSTKTLTGNVQNKIINLSKWMQKSLTFNNPSSERAYFLYFLVKALNKMQ